MAHLDATFSFFVFSLRSVTRLRLRQSRSRSDHYLCVDPLDAGLPFRPQAVAIHVFARKFLFLIQIRECEATQASL